ncbi:putative vesicle transport protein, Got1/SFT2 [Rosa chinensis]|uniref:Vesicle transport protein n=1 Tax=Rosa chinensis TaxID=74649 RepID=A0A2P6SP21_ROSCH|nr:vesicle transport protein SFT2B [Rosa chinensis]PRQ60419.1 putative vesicle transport protein, Got1/SFT2 [Rosa chinensis]
MWGKLNQSMLGGNEEGEQGFLDEESEGLCSSLSATQRMYAFGGCLLAGMVCMFLSMIVFAKPIKFAILFTFGNLLAVGSTAFLFGPAQQIRMMFDTVRIYATAIYLGCVVLALVCALLIQSKVLTLIAMICEICALIWYSLSYIPFARRMVSELMIRLCDTEL